jgi:hypothetical protein
MEEQNDKVSVWGYLVIIFFGIVLGLNLGIYWIGIRTTKEIQPEINISIDDDKSDTIYIYRRH